MNCLKYAQRARGNPGQWTKGNEEKNASEDIEYQQRDRI